MRVKSTPLCNNGESFLEVEVVADLPCSGNNSESFLEVEIVADLPCSGNNGESFLEVEVVADLPCRGNNGGSFWCDLRRHTLMACESFILELVCCLRNWGLKIRLSHLYVGGGSLTSRDMAKGEQ